VDAVVCTPAAQTSARITHQPVIEAFRDDAVIGEGLQFGGAVSTVAAAGQDPVEIDFLVCTPAPLTQHTGKRSLSPFGLDFLELLQQVDQLGHRDLASSCRCPNARDLTEIEPAQKARLAYPKQSRSVSLADRGPKRVFEKLPCRSELLSALGVE